MVDWNVRVGDLLVVASLAGSCILFAFKSGRFAESIRQMQQEIVALKDVAKVIGDVLMQVAVQKNEIKNVQDDINELKHGRGFVQGPRGINHEYP